MRDETREILSKYGRLSVTVDQLTDACDLYNAGLTSLATVGLMLALEDSFEIEFPYSMLNRKTFRSIDSLVFAIEQLRNIPARETAPPATRGSDDARVASAKG